MWRVLGAVVLIAGCVPTYGEADDAVHLKCDFNFNCCSDTHVLMKHEAIWNCEPRPIACPNPESCGDPACLDAMSALCGGGEIATGCDDADLPPAITCEAP